MIWYNIYWNDIRPVEVERETEKCVYLKCFDKGRSLKQNKISNYESYFPTREEAKAYLIQKAQDEVDRHRKWLLKHEETLAKVKAL